MTDEQGDHIGDIFRTFMKKPPSFHILVGGGMVVGGIIVMYTDFLIPLLVTVVGFALTIWGAYRLYREKKEKEVKEENE